MVADIVCFILAIPCGLFAMHLVHINTHDYYEDWLREQDDNANSFLR